MLFTPLAAVLLLLILPLAICALDVVIRTVFDSLLPRIPFEFALALLVSLGMFGLSTASGLLIQHLGHEISGLFDQVLQIL